MIPNVFVVTRHSSSALSTRRNHLRKLRSNLILREVAKIAQPSRIKVSSQRCNHTCEDRCEDRGSSTGAVYRVGPSPSPQSSPQPCEDRLMVKIILAFSYMPVST